MTNKENGLLPDKIYVRAVTNKTLSAVRPDSPIAQAEWTGKLKRTEYIRSDIARAQPQNVEGDERLQEAFKIADARNDEVKELDFGTVFWACGIFADHIRNNPKKEPSGNVNAELLEALKYAHSQMQPFCDDTIVKQAIALAEQKGQSHD